jgi:hypothetical protein
VKNYSSRKNNTKNPKGNKSKRKLEKTAIFIIIGLFDLTLFNHHEKRD